MFDEQSVIVEVWVKAVMGEAYTWEQVPNLSNLRSEVGKKLITLGFEIKVV